MDEQCRSCNLRCKVHYPTKRVPYDDSNCPAYKQKLAIPVWTKRMRMLVRFNAILVKYGKKEIEWDDTDDR